MPADRLELSTFEPHVGETFVVDVQGGGSLEVTLVEAAPSQWQPAAGSGLPHAFGLVFRSAPEVVLGQGLYPMRHPALGDLEIFMTPIARTADGIDYQAVFS